jgi:cell pole-organizing protein PopZ
MSSSEQDRIRELAERVAQKLAREPGDGGARAAEASDVSALRASLSEIQRRLAHIESHITHGEDRERDDAPAKQTGAGGVRQSSPSSGPIATPTRSMWLSGTYMPAVSHPSQEQFTGIGEAVSELVEFFEREKTCNVEPGGKPCDHCGMCSSRGF